MQGLSSPTEDLNRILETAYSKNDSDNGHPRFLIPTAPSTSSISKKGNALKKVVQRLFGGTSSALTINGKDTLDSLPLIPGSFLKRPLQRELEPDNVQNHPRCVQSKPSALRSSLTGTRIEYDASMDDLTAGTMAAPPTPLVECLEDRLASNYGECMSRRATNLPISLPELLSILARERAETIQLDPSGRLFLSPVVPHMASPHFLSKSQPTRLGRTSKMMTVKSRVISRNHCQIFKEGSNFYLADVGSNSGTFLNGMRLSPAATISSPIVVRSGDILQLGTDCGDDDDLKAVAFVLLFGSPLKVPPASLMRADQGLPSNLISSEKISKLYKKAMGAMKADQTSILYIEYGDLLHENSHGCALFARRDGPCYAVRFNNYRLSWEAVICQVKAAMDAPLLFCEAAAGRDDSFLVFQRENSADGCRPANGGKIARISLKDRKRCIVSPISPNRPFQLDRVNEEHRALTLVLNRPASPYLTIDAQSLKSPNPTSPLSSPLSRLNEPITNDFQSKLLISRPEIPFYVLSELEGLYAKDRNNMDKERLIGEGSAGNSGLLKWGRKTRLWQGNLAVCRDDALVVLGLLLQQLLTHQ